MSWHALQRVAVRLSQTLSRILLQTISAEVSLYCTRLDSLPTMSLSQACHFVSGAPGLLCRRPVGACRRCRIQIAASADGRPTFQQVAATLQAAAAFWAPAALALQGDSYAELKARAQATSRAAQQSAPEAADTAQQAADTVADQLPDWLSDQPLLLVGTACES